MKLKYITSISKVLKEAGELALALQQRAHATLKKDNTWITETDLAVETRLKEGLLKIIDAGFIGEEGTSREGKDCWIVDPIDGTHAYKQGMEDFAIAIAFWKENEGVIGAVYRPHLKQLFYAEKGKGSYLIVHGKMQKIFVSKVNEIRDATFVYDYRNKEPMLTMMSEIFERIITPLVQHRYVKSPASVGICEVARGSVDILMMPGLGRWDIVGPTLILMEAGGKYSNFRGELNQDGPTLLASNGILHERVLALVRPAYERHENARRSPVLHKSSEKIK